MSKLKSFSKARVAIIGASGGIGQALVNALQRDPAIDRVFALSRSQHSFDSINVESGFIDLEDEASIQSAAEWASQDEDAPLDLVVVAAGLLHRKGGLQPEITLNQLNPNEMLEVLKINAVGPAVVAKHFLPVMPRDRKSVFAALSARVGSITDNRLGGWASYRASKAALNMVLKSLSIEHARRFRQAAVIALHPGTVDTPLSEPFSSRVPEGQLFAPSRAAEYLLQVIDDVTPDMSGEFLAWDGSRIDY